MNKRLMLGFYKDKKGKFTYKNHFTEQGEDGFEAEDIVFLMGLSARFIKDMLRVMKDPEIPQYITNGILGTIVNGLLSVNDEDVVSVEEMK